MAASTLRCPTCKKTVTTDGAEFPFCSDRCRILDLGKWASGEYRISSPVMDPDLLEEIESGSLRTHRSGADDSDA